MLFNLGHDPPIPHQWRRTIICHLADNLDGSFVASLIRVCMVQLTSVGRDQKRLLPQQYPELSASSLRPSLGRFTRSLPPLGSCQLNRMGSTSHARMNTIFQGQFSPHELRRTMPFSVLLLPFCAVPMARIASGTAPYSAQTEGVGKLCHGHHVSASPAFARSACTRWIASPYLQVWFKPEPLPRLANPNHRCLVKQLRDLAIPCGRVVAQQIEGTPGITG